MTTLETLTISKEHINSSAEQRNSPAFFRLMELCRPIHDINDNESLHAWRMERFIHEGAD